MDVLVLIGRILFASLFLLSAVNHLTRTAMTAAYTKSKGVPAAVPATIGSGLLILAGGLSAALGSGRIRGRCCWRPSCSPPRC
ncbi:DoxX family membrane protein [Streptomyces sp. TRM70350]|uniref:DoxX family protein n=1 Tax=Streptomyces sp. TRM70350 TaxID=2856165 RepID=UPI0027E1D4FA|nr:DoxX family membrane protein [Streptomyces sp. TRM70350]